MADKVTLINLTKVDATVTGDLNTNFTRLADAIDDAVSRDGTSPNYLTDNLDLNGFQIKNSAAPTDDNDLARLGDIADQVNLAEDWATEIGGTVDGSEYAAKEYAQGTTASGGTAKQWAQKTASAVASGLFSAKAWARSTLMRGAADGGSARDWATLTGQTADDTEYGAKEHAVGTTVPGGSAQQWATETGTVSSGLKGARGYAQDASGSASAAATSESNASTSEANALSYLEDFKGRWLGAQASDPTTDLNGDPVTAGDAYFNTSGNEIRVYDGSTFRPIPSDALGQGDLAQNGGTVPQVDRNETITRNYTFNPGSLLVDIQTFKNDDNLHNLRFRWSTGPVIQWVPSDSNGDSLFNRRLQYDYTDLVWSFIGPVSVGSAADPGTGLNAEELYEAGNRVGPIESATVELGGDFDAGEEATFYRRGNMVDVVLDGLSHDSVGQATSAELPSQWQPSVTGDTDVAMVGTFISGDSGAYAHVVMTALGELRISYLGSDGSGHTTSSTGRKQFSYNLN